MGKIQIVNDITKALEELYQTPLPLKLKDKLLRQKCKKTAKLEIRFLNNKGNNNGK